MRAAAIAGLALLLGASAAAAQAAELARIDSMIADSHFTEARNALQRWLASAEGRSAAAEDAIQALMLRARLLTAADSALPIYLEVALGHPSSRQAPEALLRLGQGYFAAGDYERAAARLAQLSRDYPTSAQRQLAQLWLVRAQRARGRNSEACSTLTQALRQSTTTADVRALLEREQAACTAGAAKDSTLATPPTAPPPTAPPQKEPAKTSPVPTGNYTIQIAAFRDPAGARALAERLRRREIDARTVKVGDGTLVHVRAGRFRTRADALGLLQRVRAVAPDAVIADDAARERPLSR